MAPKQKYVLDLGLSDDFTLLGIACHARDYRFCWMLNQQLGIKLRKIRDFFPETTQPGSENGFACYFAEYPFLDEQFYLLNNRSDGRDLVDKYRQVDYFLFVRDLAYPGGPRALVEEVKKIPQVLMAFPIDLGDFRDAEFILEGMEMTRQIYEKESRLNVLSCLNLTVNEEHDRSSPASVRG